MKRSVLHHPRYVPPYIPPRRHWHHSHWHPWCHHHHRWHLVFVVQGVGVFLTPKETMHMSVTLAVGHTLNLALVFLDQHGNPMLEAPVPDAAPAWSDTTPATETLVADASGLTATATPLVAGTDTISVVVLVGGTSFAVSLDVNVTPEPQVLTAVDITPTVT